MSFFKSKSDAKSDPDFYDLFEFGSCHQADHDNSKVKPDPDFYDRIEFEAFSRYIFSDDWKDD